MNAEGFRRRSSHGFLNKLLRVLWGGVWLFLFRTSPKLLFGWRRFLLRTFGARIGSGACIHPSARIWAPWNLEMGSNSCLGFDVDCYCVAPIKIGARTTISQYSYLCTASHDFELTDMPLVTRSISIGDDAWIAADVFIGPGVTVGNGAVVGARSTAWRDVEAWTVVAGNPARLLRARTLRSSLPIRDEV